MSGDDESMDRFLSDLVHDLRNLQEGVRTALFHSENADSELRGAIDREVQDLVRKVENFLDLSRLRREGLHLEQTAVSLSAVCRSSARMLSSSLERRKISFTPGLEDTVARADPGALKKIVRAMIHVAARLTRAGDSIAIEGGGLEGRAVLAVGFPAMPDLAERVDSLFSLANCQGESLGVAREIALLSGGDLACENRGDRARFVLTLPAEPAFHFTPEPAKRAKGEKLSILVVDDRRDSAKSLAMLLSVAGHETDVRHDGRSALEAVRSRPPDVVLLDIGLPDIDGYEVCRVLRESREARNTLLVAVSGRGDDEARTQSREAGFDGHLLKPIDRKELDELLQELPAK